MWASTFSTAPSVIFFTFLPSAPVTSSVIEANSPRFDEPVFGSSQRLKLNATSSALNGSPFDHVMPLRRWNVQVFRSGDACHFSARYGRVTLSGPVMTRYSTIRRATLDFGVQSKVEGSVISCTRVPTLSTPPFPAWACAVGVSGWPVIRPAIAYAVVADRPRRVEVRRNSRRLTRFRRSSSMSSGMYG